jgi:hypothetical protein
VGEALFTLEELNDFVQSLSWKFAGD